MRKLLIYVLLFGILINLSFALFEKEVYKNWANSGESFVIENESFRTVFIRQANQTIVYFPSGFSVVINPVNSSCSDEWIYRVCQDGQRFEKKGAAVPPTINDPYIDILLYLSINKTDISLNFKRDFSKQEIFKSDILDVKLSINKTGNEAVNNILFEDKYSSNFEISNVIGCEKQGNFIMWKGDLNKTSKKTCSYKIRPLKSINFSNTAKLSYDILGKTKTIEIKKDFEINDVPVILDVNLSSHSLDAGENFTGEINIQAINDLKLDGLTIILPDHFRIKNASEDFRIVNKKIILPSLELKKGENKKLLFETGTTFIGYHEINLDYEYVYNQIRQKLNKILFVNYSSEVFYVDFYKKQNSSIIRLTNPGDSFYRDITVDIGNFSFEIKRLESKRFKEFEFPITQEEDVNLKYRTIFGQIIETNHVLAYGESTYKSSELEEQKNESVKNEVVLEETNKQAIVDFDSDAILKIAVIIVIVIFGLGIFSLLRSKSQKSDLDHDIEELRKSVDK